MSFGQLMEHAHEIKFKAWTESPYLDQEAYYGHVPGLYQPFAEMPDPSAFDPMIEQLAVALNRLARGDSPKDPINGTPCFAVQLKESLRCSERSVPEAVEVALRASQVQGERVVEHADAGEGAFQAVDGAGGGLELLMQPVGHVVGGCAFGR